MAGLLLLLLGFVMAISARIELGTAWHPTPAVDEEQQLITTGLYGFVRHPIYVAQTVLALGTAAVLGNWIVALVFTGGLFAYNQARARREDVLLERHFGIEYHAYRDAVSGWVPFAGHAACWLRIALRRKRMVILNEVSGLEV
jgi:protein-S-isoprenylcysteine O-methyltransferase Ste14